MLSVFKYIIKTNLSEVKKDWQYYIQLKRNLHIINKLADIVKLDLICDETKFESMGQPLACIRKVQKSSKNKNPLFANDKYCLHFGLETDPIKCQCRDCPYVVQNNKY